MTTIRIDDHTKIALDEAGRDFARVAPLVDKYGCAVITTGDAPKYLSVPFAGVEVSQTAPDETVREVSRRLLEQNAETYRELAASILRTSAPWIREHRREAGG